MKRFIKDNAFWLGVTFIGIGLILSPTESSSFSYWGGFCIGAGAATIMTSEEWRKKVYTLRELLNKERQKEWDNE